MAERHAPPPTHNEKMVCKVVPRPTSIEKMAKRHAPTPTHNLKILCKVVHKAASIGKMAGQHAPAPTHTEYIPCEHLPKHVRVGEGGILVDVLAVDYILIIAQRSTCLKECREANTEREASK